MKQALSLIIRSLSHQDFFLEPNLAGLLCEVNEESTLLFLLLPSLVSSLPYSETVRAELPHPWITGSSCSFPSQSAHPISLPAFCLLPSSHLSSSKNTFPRNGFNKTPSKLTLVVSSSKSIAHFFCNSAESLFFLMRGMLEKEGRWRQIIRGSHQIEGTFLC